MIHRVDSSETEGTVASVELDVDVKPVVSLAMAHNRIPVVEQVRITNRGSERRGLTLHVTVDDGEGPVSRP